MRFQKTTEYAIRVMVYLAKHKEEILSARTLHEALEIPYKYLGRLMSKLADAKLVDVKQGSLGGYQLTKSLDTIYLYQIANLVEGLEDYERCILGFQECSDDHPCSLHNQWVPHRENIKSMLYETSLADLENGPAEQL
ncbi:MAG: Rrf2 family transcriptional regulator [Chloroflexota bacterium]|nr:MAG: Rrf2 family transcriptional regulator [Chloroflexota bacterium]